jgi:hypothetical protein
VQATVVLLDGKMSALTLTVVEPENAKAGI